MKQLIDFRLLSVVIFLIIFGLVMSYSSSIYHADVLTGDPNYFIKRQFINLVIALILGFSTFKLMPMISLERHSTKIFIFTLFLLILVFVPGIGVTINNSSRWINLVFLTFQSSELLKLTMILFMASLLVRQSNSIQTWQGLLIVSLMICFVMFLLLLETDVGASIIVLSTSLAMLWVVGAHLKTLFGIASIGGISLALIVVFIPERLARIMAFIDPWGDPYGKGYQLTQSLISIGKGEWLGVGLGAGVQKVHFLPDAHTDFIFAVVGEELGVAGMLLLVFAFAYIIFKAIIISQTALKQGEEYSSHTAFGIAILLSLQVFIHIGVNTGALPTKGLTLPLFSYGGSSMLITILALAILFRIDYENRKKPHPI